MPTLEEIEAARTPGGGWTREQLAAWGVGWPPRKGWKRDVAKPERARAAAHSERDHAEWSESMPPEDEP